MKRTKRISAILITAVMVLGLFVFTPPVAGASTIDGVDDAAKFTRAMVSGNNVVINITGSFKLTIPGLSIRNTSKDVTINLNGNTLTANVINLYTTSNNNKATLTINGPGTFDAMNIEAQGPGSVITTTGGAVVNVIGGSHSGAQARDGGKLMITGDATGSGFGAIATGEGSVVIVKGNATSTNAYDGSGAYATQGGITIVGGNAIDATQTSLRRSTGAGASRGGKVYVCGDIIGSRAGEDITLITGGFFSESKILSVSNPTGTNVDAPAPYDGFSWDGFQRNDCLWDEWSNIDLNPDNPSYVYKRQATPGGSIPVPTDPVSAFVVRLYNNVLERTPVQSEIDAWVERLVSGEWGGGQVAENFFFGAPYYEFLNRGLNNEQFLYIMYRTFMDREPDETGWPAWLDRMANQGYTWEDVFTGFVASQEWGDRCDAAGIRR